MRFRFIRDGLIVLLLALPASGYADEQADLKQKLETMERRLQMLEENRATGDQPAKATSKEADLKQKLEIMEMRVQMLEETQASAVVEPAKAASKVYIGAFGSMEYKAFDGETNSFDGHRLELFLGANLTDKLKVHGLVEYEGAMHTEYLADEGVNSRSGEVKTEEVYVQFDAAKWFKLRLGSFYVPFGYYNQNNHDPYQPYTELPLVMRRVFPSEYSDTGVNIMGDFGLTPDLNMQYSVAVVNGLTDKISATGSGLRASRPSLRKDNNNNKAMVGRLGWVLMDKYELGISGYSGAYDEDSDNFSKALGADARVHVTDKLSFEGEYVSFDLDSGLNYEDKDVPSQLTGFYVQANYSFWPEALSETILGRWSSSPEFSVHYRYGEAKIEQEYDVPQDLKEYRNTIAFDYHPHPNIVLKNEYQFNSGDLEHGDNDGYVFSLAFIFP